jgi:myosin heavy subunit
MPSKPTFIIVHTAKDVEYTINGFRDKNKDEVPPLMMKITQGSTNSLVSALFTGDKLKKDKSLSKKVRS